MKPRGKDSLTRADREYAFCNQGNAGRTKEPTTANLITIQDNTETKSNLDNTIFGYRQEDLRKIIATSLMHMCGSLSTK